jgi:hypothetical protein
MVASIGQTIGLISGTIWVSYLPVEFFVIPLSALSLISAVLATILIKEPQVVFERQILIMHKPSFFNRLRNLPYLFLKIPSLNDFKRIFRILRHELLRNTALIYLSIVCFFFSAGLFNTSLVPALDANGLPNLMAFLVILLGLVVQIGSFRFAGPYTEKKSPIKSATAGLLLRAIAYGLLGILAYFIAGFSFLILVLIFYPLASGIAYSIYYTATNTMVFNSLSPSPRNNGSHLGVFSALAGAATMLGSLSSGFVSFYLGFYVTFIIASLCLVISAWLLSLVD